MPYSAFHTQQIIDSFNAITSPFPLYFLPLSKSYFYVPSSFSSIQFIHPKPLCTACPCDHSCPSCLSPEFIGLSVVCSFLSAV